MNYKAISMTSKYT